MLGLFAFALAVGFGLCETAHFGWNMVAHSDAELICDGITGLMMIGAMAVSAIETH